jgi:hypothetical protein
MVTRRIIDPAPILPSNTSTLSDAANPPEHLILPH